MTYVLLAVLTIGLLIAATVWAVVRIGPSVVLTSHDANEAAIDQAPLAYALLAELTPALDFARPRLFVIPDGQPNGFAVIGRNERIVAVTESVFDKLSTSQLRALLALLVANLVRPRARLETAVAALALAVAPFVLPSVALVRVGLRGDRWHDVDTAAASLVGVEPIAETLAQLEAQRGDGRRGSNLATASLFCVSPGAPTPTGWLDRAFVTQPATEARLAHLRERTSRPPGVIEPRAPDPASGRR